VRGHLRNSCEGNAIAATSNPRTTSRASSAQLSNRVRHSCESSTAASPAISSNPSTISTSTFAIGRDLRVDFQESEGKAWLRQVMPIIPVTHLSAPIRLSVIAQINMARTREN
jgi:hypothetical protein